MVGAGGTHVRWDGCIVRVCNIYAFVYGAWVCVEACPVGLKKARLASDAAWCAMVHELSAHKCLLVELTFFCFSPVCVSPPAARW